jgi:hypothetical protein
MSSWIGYSGKVDPMSVPNIRLSAVEHQNRKKVVAIYIYIYTLTGYWDALKMGMVSVTESGPEMLHPTSWRTLCLYV